MIKVHSEFIKKTVEHFFEVEDIDVSSREQYIVDARFAYVKLCKEYTHLEDAQIMETIHRDRSSIYKAMNRFTELYGVDSKFKRKYQFVEAQIKFSPDSTRLSLEDPEKRKLSFGDLAAYHFKMHEYYLNKVELTLN